MESKRIYLAGPQVFLRDPFAVAESKKRLCLRYGYEGVFPMDQDLDLSGSSPEEQAAIIFKANIDLMNSCDIIIADMTPYRGESMDVGTAFEIGYMYSQNKPVFGYSNTNLNFSERSSVMEKLTPRPGEQGVLEDQNGMRIEGFGNLADNLMCSCCLTLPPALLSEDILGSLSGDELFQNLTAFQECLTTVKKNFS